MKREPSSKSLTDSGIDDERKQQDYYTDDDEMELEEDYELDPPRPELNNIISQSILLLNTPSNSPPHPRTLFFLYDPEYNENKPNKNYTFSELEITERKYMVLYKAYKNLPLCLSEPMAYNGIIRSKLFDNTNLIWKLLKHEKMYPILRSLNKYQRYNHFPCTWQLSRKDNLYNNYIKMQKNFPNDFNYMPETYILPRDKEIFYSKMEDYTIDKDNMWLIKPVASSRGRGIRLMTDINNVPDKTLITHYIPNPYLINGKKFDLRLYLFITGYSPLKIYLFDNGLTRFCSEEYDLDINKMTNRYIHLTNYSINKTSTKYEKNEDADKEEGNKWTLSTLIKHFKQNNIDFKPCWEKICDIMIKTILSITDSAIPTIKQFKVTSCNLFEVYGVDILLTDNLDPWLIEFNLNPSLNCDSELDMKIKSKLLTDMFNIIGLVPFTHNEKIQLIDKEIIYKDYISEAVNEALCEFARPTGGFQRIFPLKDNIKKYMKFFEKADEENKALWEVLLK